ncbi:Pulcherriminic acid synthase [Streptomyces xanthophaeus]|uniref:cytochrome P450 n=1 Tax=Streptomyces xanthophaeus TaxID=67385 RepID=UPI00233F165A|nr:cytochrome P450 [Streptomyces xanthophaeus]WCD84275.1 Pulcherriminic acid synthase [Streptomyces xanthophaeus]
MTAAQHVPDILSKKFAENPYPTYRSLRDSPDLVWHEATQSYLVSRYEDVARVFKDKESLFTTDNYAWQAEPVHGKTLLQMSGREHATRRALVAPAFRGNELREKVVPLIERNARELIDGFRDTGAVDLVSGFASHFPITVIADMFGLDRSGQEHIAGWYRAFVAFTGNLSGDPECAAAGARAQAEFAAYMLPVIGNRRDHLGDDLLSALCTAEVDGVRMSDEDIKAFCSLLLTAGAETTDKAIAGLFANLLANPAQLEAVRQDRGLIDRAFAETLRYSPPVHMIMRQAATDVPMSAGTVPAGATVTCLIGAANRDPERYADPDRFDILRDDLTATTAFSAAADHLAFALGRHFCVGALLARAEVEIATNQLLDAMPDIRPADGYDPAEQGVFTRGPKSLRVEFTPTAG